MCVKQKVSKPAEAKTSCPVEPMSGQRAEIGNSASYSAGEPAKSSTKGIDVEVEAEPRKLCGFTRKSFLKFTDEVLALSMCGQLGIVCRDFLTAASKDVLVAPLFSALASNMLGSFAMGVLCDGKAASAYVRRAEPDSEGLLTAEANKVKGEKMPLLANLKASGGMASVLLGMRTGYCGAFTTLSSWNQSMVEHVVKAGGPTFADSFVGYLIGLLASVMSVVLGQMFALYIFELNIQGAWYSVWPHAFFAACGRRPWLVRLSFWALFLTGLALISAYAATLEESDDDRDLCFALLFGPLGVLLRWKLGKLLNAKFAPFPLGTFAANVLGCIGVGITKAVLDDPNGDSYWVSLQMAAIGLGFCGSLSTVSTFVTEVVDRLQPIAIKGAKAKSCTLWGVIYPVGTLAAGFVVGLASYGWSVWAYD
uniref:Fluoride ion transporter CrcB n=1 Tax=Chrysotila carterae TaxID=13221 RepID=A0A7S4C0N6_CHRCT